MSVDTFKLATILTLAIANGMCWVGWKRYLGKMSSSDDDDDDDDDDDVEGGGCGVDDDG